MGAQPSNIDGRGGDGSRVSYDRALDIIVRDAFSLGAEVLDLDLCHGRVLAEAVVAGVNVPAYARAAVDGFAVRSADLDGASESFPIELAIHADYRPGDATTDPLPPRTCARVATGAPLPDAADVVVMIEDVNDLAGRVRFSSFAPARKHIIQIGEDVSAGEELLSRGRCLRPQDLGVIASLEIAALLVVKRPRVELLVTGDEIVSPGTSRTGTKIIDSSSIVLRHLARRDGAQTLETSYVADDPSAIRAAIERSDADVILVTGGSSVGAEDHAPRVLADVGTLLVRGVDMRPGSPTSFGRLGERWVFLLPGHPLACLAAYELLAGPAIRRVGGRSHESPQGSFEVPLADAVDSIEGRTDYVRVLVDDEGAHPLRHHTGASNLSSAVRADGAFVLPSDVTRLEVGRLVRVYRY